MGQATVQLCKWATMDPAIMATNDAEETAIAGGLSQRTVWMWHI